MRLVIESKIPIHLAPSLFRKPSQTGCLAWTIKSASLNSETRYDEWDHHHRWDSISGQQIAPPTPLRPLLPHYLIIINDVAMSGRRPAPNRDVLHSHPHPSPHHHHWPTRRVSLPPTVGYLSCYGLRLTLLSRRMARLMLLLINEVGQTSQQPTKTRHQSHRHKASSHHSSSSSLRIGNHPKQLSQSTVIQK